MNSIPFKLSISLKTTHLSTISSYNNSKGKKILNKPTKTININDKTKEYLNLYLTSGWLTERIKRKKCLKNIK